MQSGRALRTRLGLLDELLLALLPTGTILLVLVFVEVLSEQQVLFTSLASSAMLIYVDPEHPMNTVRTLAISQLGAALIGLGCHFALGDGYVAAGVAVIGTIGAMVALDILHPPAVGTALSFVFRVGVTTNLVLFVLAVTVTAVLVGLQRYAVWYYQLRLRHREGKKKDD
jgi:CBS-domain-containing membrane protein